MDSPNESPQPIFAAEHVKTLECRLTQVIELEGDGNFMVVARVEAIHLCDDCFNNAGHFDVTRFRPLTRLDYQDFAAIGKVSQMKLPGL